MATGIPQSALDFLKQLSKNNNRDWFNRHKENYGNELDHMVRFAEEVLSQMSRHDKIETASGKKVLHRIYKDTRFSKDKIPYKTHWAGSFSRATQQLRGGYYFHLELGNSFAAGGFFGPSADDLKRIRQDIDLNHQDWIRILTDKKFLKTFGKLRGDVVASAPRGYPKDHEAIELLRHKQFLIRHDFTDKEVLASRFAQTLDNTFQDMRPFFDHMSEVLTTDLNGVSIIP